MVGDPAPQWPHRDPALLEQFGQQLGVVVDGLGQAELGVLVGQRVEGMGVGGEDLGELGLPEGGQVLLQEHLEEALLPHPAHVVPGVALVLVEDAEVDAGVVEDLGQGSGQATEPLFEAGVVAHEPEVLDRFLAGVLHREVQALRPPGPHPGRLPEGVPLGGQVLEGVLEGGVHRPLVDQGTP